jgi:hypothetical protein
MLMGSISVSDLLVANAICGRQLGLNLSVRHREDRWTAALVDGDGDAVVQAERAFLDDTLMTLYTAAQTAAPPSARRRSSARVAQR